MNYKKYQKSRNATWEILLKLKIKELPVKVIDLCRRLGIPVKFADLGAEQDGYTIMIDGQPIIVINSLKRDNAARMRFTIAHELGHIMLGHVGVYELVNREPSPGDNDIEREANVFASRLLAPACVLWGCNVKSPEEIMQLCDISRQSAQFRFNRMKILYARQKFLTSHLEKKVYKRFKPFMLRYLLKLKRF